MGEGCLYGRERKRYQVRVAVGIPLVLDLKGGQDWPAQCGSGEMANTLALGASAARLRGSSPLFRTNTF